MSRREAVGFVPYNLYQSNYSSSTQFSLLIDMASMASISTVQGIVSASAPQMSAAASSTSSSLKISSCSVQYVVPLVVSKRSVVQSMRPMGCFRVRATDEGGVAEKVEGAANKAGEQVKGAAREVQDFVTCASREAKDTAQSVAEGVKDKARVSRALHRLLSLLGYSHFLPLGLLARRFTM